jgi:hypothetical protein
VLGEGNRSISGDWCSGALADVSGKRDEAGLRCLG